METSFSIEKTQVNGKEYINIKADVFHLLFIELMKYTDIDGNLIKGISKKYEDSKKVKKKRISLKKQKQMLASMYKIIDYKFIEKH